MTRRFCFVQATFGAFCLFNGWRLQRVVTMLYGFTQCTYRSLTYLCTAYVAAGMLQRAVQAALDVLLEETACRLTSVVTDNVTVHIALMN